jgi:DNA-binding NtrC family response regulator
VGGGEMADARSVAILNTNDDIVLLLRALLESEGFHVVTGHIRHIKDGRLDLRAFVEEFDPGVIVYDISPPYEENWRFFQLLATTDAAKGRRFVLTTTNKAILDRLVGETGAHEIVGKPFDLDAVVQAVRRAAGGEGRPVGEVKP